MLERSSSVKHYYLLKSNTRLPNPATLRYYVPIMPAVISKKKATMKPAEKKRKDYQEVVVEPAKRLAALLDHLDHKSR